MNEPWTKAEIDALLPKIKDSMADLVAGREYEIRPILPMTTGECLDYFWRILDLAMTRPLTEKECFFHGQLLAVYKHAIQAEMIGKPGRYFVVSEADIIDRLKAEGVR